MLIDHWPQLGLRLDTPRLEIRLPSDEELAELADLAAEGIHSPDRMPFQTPWTDLPPRERARSVIQHHWRLQSAWAPENWALNLAVLENGRVLGMQSMEAQDYALLRVVATGSWLGSRHQGRGIGREMRAAVLHLAFAGLGAAEATSGAFEDNLASLSVSRRLGYQPDGIERLAVRGTGVLSHRLRLKRAGWQQHAEIPVSITGLEPCLPLFGLPDGVTESPEPAAGQT